MLPRSNSFIDNLRTSQCNQVSCSLSLCMYKSQLSYVDITHSLTKAQQDRGSSRFKDLGFCGIGHQVQRSQGHYVSPPMGSSGGLCVAHYETLAIS